MNTADASPSFQRSRPWILPLILAMAALLRLWKLGSLPPAVFRDEAEKALNGWFLLNGGVDASGRSWPVFIEVFGVTTSAIYQYLTIPFLAIGGLNEWTARLPAAVAGVATVYFTWILARRVWGWQTAVWAAGLIAISPWAIPLSRWAQQGVLLPLLYTIAVWAMANWEHRDKSLHELRSAPWLMLTGASLAIAMYTYDPARLFAPLLALSAAIIWWKQWLRHWQTVLLAFVTFLLFASPVIWLFLNEADAAQARFQFLSVFQPGMPLSVGLRQFASNYIAHFSPAFLLLQGDRELRHSGGVGMLNIVEFAFALIGAGFAIRRRCRWGLFLISWILLAPVASSLTRIGVPHALRTQVALPAWQVLAAVGIVSIADLLAPSRQRLWHQIIILITLAGSLPFFLSYYSTYAQRSAFNWQYGVKQALQYLNNPQTQYSTVYFHNVVGAEYLVPFYLQMDRKEFRNLQTGRGRYQLLPFQQPDRPIPAVPEPPTAYVSPPGYNWSPDLAAVPVTAPKDEQTRPVMLIYLNPALMEQVKEQTRQ